MVNIGTNTGASLFGMEFYRGVPYIWMASCTYKTASAARVELNHPACARVVFPS